MSIFELSERDKQEYQSWMQDIREQISENVDSKSGTYCFNFDTSEPIPNRKYAWEQAREPAKRLSTIRFSMRSSVSTNPTLTDELIEDIPEISEHDLRISQELMLCPIVLLPHKR